MAKKLRIGIIFGGKSAEHEVSLQSAKSIVNSLDKTKYEPVLIGIDKSGKWYLHDSAKYLLNDNNPKLVKLNKSNKALALTFDAGGKQLVSISAKASVPAIDVAFPVLHGTNGEDGAMQGLLKLMDVPFVGGGVLASALCMDKDFTKRILNAANIAVSKWLVLKAGEKHNFAYVKKALGLPIFVKPANAGSSVGISKVKNETDFKKAITEAFRYDSKILVEEYIAGREIEVSVLGNENPIASLPGEVVPKHEFYSYEAKYIDEKGAELKVPAELPAIMVKKLKLAAIEAFQTLGLEGMARVDFFLTKTGKLYLNEVNTIPGFTKISMYPKLWEISGLPYPRLLDALIGLAIERYQKEKKLKTSFN